VFTVTRTPCGLPKRGEGLLTATPRRGLTASPSSLRGGEADAAIQGHRQTALIGVGKAFASPPSEPHVRFSRIRLSSRWFPHRGCLAHCQAVCRANSPAFAK